MVNLSPQESVVWIITGYDIDGRPCRWITGQTVPVRSVLETSFAHSCQASTREADKWSSFKDDTGRMVYHNWETGEEQHDKPDCKKKYSAIS